MDKSIPLGSRVLLGASSQIRVLLYSGKYSIKNVTYSGS